MISVAPWRPAPETRSYTSAVVNAIESDAAGTAASVAAATAVGEVASRRGRLCCRWPASSRRTGARRRSRRPRLAMMCRALSRSAEVLFDLRVSARHLTMLPASAAYVTTGDGDRRTSVDTVTVDCPGDAGAACRMRNGVAHLQYMVDPVRPWIGRPAWASASLSGTLIAAIERHLARRGDPAVGSAAGSFGRCDPRPAAQVRFPVATRRLIEAAMRELA